MPFDDGLVVGKAVLPSTPHLGDRDAAALGDVVDDPHRLGRGPTSLTFTFAA